MNKKGKMTRRILAFILSFAMVMTSISFPSFTMEVKADTEPTVSESTIEDASTADPDVALLSVSKFMDASQLRNRSNYTNGDELTQKVRFGNGKVWRFAGAQQDDLVLLCDWENPLTTIAFNSDRSFSDKTYEGQTVYANHYGASEIRAYLNGDAMSNFTTSEQSLMKETTVYTDDARNGGAYATTDRLYLPYKGNQILNASMDSMLVGANSADALGTGLACFPEKGLSTSKNMVMLRTPAGKNSDFFYLKIRAVTYTGYLYTPMLVIPAFHLDLNSILFASAANAATENMTTSNVGFSNLMTIRFKDDGKIGSSATACSEIAITKGTDASDLYLYVQGKDGETDWIYSKKITESGSVTPDEIKEAKELTDVDLTQCKIWLETTLDRVTYAK